MATTITTAADLQNMALDLTGDYELGNDIDCSGIANFKPVGGWGGAAAFTGSFDGKGYTISNLVVDRAADDKIGLFGETDGATIQNVTVEATLTGDDDMGGLVGISTGCTYTNCTLLVTIIGDADIGGMIGQSDGSDTFVNCNSSGTLTAEVDIGGLIGYIDSSATLTDCHSSCSIAGINTIGGLIGSAGTSALTRCYATGAIIATGTGIGGLIGMTTTTTLSRCFSSGNVSTSDPSTVIGGLVGYANLEEDNYNDCYSIGNVTASDAGGTHMAGGLVGRNWGSLVNCYSIGLLTVAGAGNKIGGLVGSQETDSSASYCFWDTETSGEADAVGDGLSTGITGKTTAQMKNKYTFKEEGWDFLTVWAMCIGGVIGYPCLLSIIPGCAHCWKGSVIIDQLVYQHAERMR